MSSLLHEIESINSKIPKLTLSLTPSVESSFSAPCAFYNTLLSFKEIKSSASVSIFLDN